MRYPGLEIRRMQPGEYGCLEEFLYQAIYLPPGVVPPPRDVVHLPELRVYTDGFGTKKGDYCLVAQAEGWLLGAVWSRIMRDYGHIDDTTPSLALSVLSAYRGQGIGTRLLHALLSLLQGEGYGRVSLSVQKENPALHLYQRAGFEIWGQTDTEYRMLRNLAPGPQPPAAPLGPAGSPVPHKSRAPGEDQQNKDERK